MSSHEWNKKKPAANPDTQNTPNRSSRNALRHGCCAMDTSLLDSEFVEDFKALEATWLTAYNPKDDAERHLVIELVNADWLLQRSTQRLLEMETTVFNSSLTAAELPEVVHSALSRFQRYRTANANLVHKARKAIDEYRKSRLNEKLGEQKLAKAEKAAREPAKVSAAAPKLEKRERTWKETVEEMREKAALPGSAPPDPDSF